ncbi:helix-turn-helix domain-containing protein [Duganella qianjiadongensis]|uniref:XRE family transcriptional regulator n=1 Tax=Duganella qianjiadongensis TaxID=2692176 RepID=A0ABW9VFG5_9BURK|nr:helix-turn-helix transcriptional regulator [Duganella qianjiadongensis]MYM38353.1 XRE family transcriptional regulator [Duganella qianjiadongensis]
MNPEPVITHVTPADGNVFADLGFEATEARRLLAETDAIISAKLAIKHSLMSELAECIQRKNLKPADAADMLGITHASVSDLMNRNSVRFTIDALVDMLARTGKEVKISIR